MKPIVKLGLIALSLLISLSAGVFVIQASQTFYHRNENNLWDIMENWRVSQNLPLLTKNDFTCEVASKRVIETESNFSHEGFWKFTTNLKGYQIMGENLARKLPTDQSMFDGWVGSPKHLENLKNPQYTYSCIKCDSNYCAQEFSNF